MQTLSFARGTCCLEPCKRRSAVRGNECIQLEAMDASVCATLLLAQSLLLCAAPAHAPSQMTLVSVCKALTAEPGAPAWGMCLVHGRTCTQASNRGASGERGRASHQDQGTALHGEQHGATAGLPCSSAFPWTTQHICVLTCTGAVIVCHCVAFSLLNCHCVAFSKLNGGCACAGS